MKPHPPAARSARRQQAHTKHTEAAAVSGRGRFPHQKCASCRAAICRTHARTHTHTAPVKRMFFGWNSLRRHTHAERTYTQHTRTSSKHTSAPRTRAPSPRPPTPPRAQRSRDAAAHSRTQLRCDTPYPSPLPPLFGTYVSPATIAPKRGAREVLVFEFDRTTTPFGGYL